MTLGEVSARLQLTCAERRAPSCHAGERVPVTLTSLRMSPNSSELLQTSSKMAARTWSLLNCRGSHTHTFCSSCSERGGPSQRPFVSLSGQSPCHPRGPAPTAQDSPTGRRPAGRTCLPPPALRPLAHLPPEVCAPGPRSPCLVASRPQLKDSHPVPTTTPDSSLSHPSSPPNLVVAGCFTARLCSRLLPRSSPSRPGPQHVPRGSCTLGGRG